MKVGHNCLTTGPKKSLTSHGIMLVGFDHKWKLVLNWIMKRTCNRKHGGSIPEFICLHINVCFGVWSKTS